MLNSEKSHAHETDCCSCGCSCGSEPEPVCEEASCGCHSAENKHSEAGCACQGGEEEGQSFGVVMTRCAAALALLLGGAFLPENLLWLTWALHIAGWLVAGYDIALETVRRLSAGKIFDENFLMTLATIGAFCIGSTAEAVAVMLFYQVGEALQARAVRRSRRSISELCDIRPETATLIEGGTERTVPAEKVSVGQLILIRPGERIPLDGEVVDGSSTVDTAALTGESLPREAIPGTAVLAGTVNKTGVLTVLVTAAASDTVAARMLELVEHASERKAPVELFITRFARIYTPIVMLLAVLVALAQPLFIKDVTAIDQVRSALVFLVTSCPCALVISIPLTYFAGVGRAARKGVLVKGSHAMDVLAGTELVIFDKTGTLTEGRFSVASAIPAEGVDISELNRCAAIAELRSHHPLAASLREYCGDAPPPADSYMETAGLGVSAQAGNRLIHAGSATYMKRLGIEVPEVTGTVVHIASNDCAVGYYTFKDSPRPDSARTISALKKGGIRAAMLSGDTPHSAAETAQALGIDDCRAGLLPEGKLEAMEALMAETRGKTLFVGDGLNDAAVLARADAGVAMGITGVDAAIEAADVVLMSDSPWQLAEGIRLSRKTRGIAVQNIVFALAFKAAVLTLGTLGIAPLWLAIVADVGVSLLAVLNALRVR